MNFFHMQYDKINLLEYKIHAFYFSIKNMNQSQKIHQLLKKSIKKINKKNKIQSQQQ